MTKCHTDGCYNEATFMLKIRGNSFQTSYGKFSTRYKICDKCHDDLNPEHKRRVIVPYTEEDEREFKEAYPESVTNVYDSAHVFSFRRLKE